tara:strand:+ start:175 stop:402 length:228 start_codon:yes stop_codon:yes gene_type:complete
MNQLDADPLLIKFTLDQTRKERDKAVEDLKKSNTKVMKSVEVINMLTSRIKMETYFTKKECEDVQNYIYLAMNNF